MTALAPHGEALENTITVLEKHRATLGDKVVDTAVDALREAASRRQARPTSTERKQVTILFADVSGFTALSETIDAEEVNAWMNALWTPIDTAIVEHGGFIDKHIGDAIMAIFGTPLAREDDPERAVSAALAIQHALADFNQRYPDQKPLKMRIGINTGPVVLGEVGTTGEFTAIGDAVNLASRLETAAPVGGLLISHDTYRQVRGVFAAVPNAPMSVKGKKEPVLAYRVTHRKPRVFHMRTRGVEGIHTPMVGREVQFQALRETFLEVTQSGRLRALTICGDAGIGKSRLIFEFVQWIDHLEARVRVFKGRSAPQSQRLPGAVFRDMLAYRFRIRDSDTPEVSRNKFSKGVTELLGRADEEAAHFLGHLLGFDFSGSTWLRGAIGQPERLRSRAFFYMTRLLKAASSDCPLVLLVEDLHWTDPLSLDLLRHIIQVCGDLQILLLSTARPVFLERFPSWPAERGGRSVSNHGRLVLRPLSEEHSRELVGELLLLVANLPSHLCDTVVKNAEGNPYYVEEFIKMLIDERVIRKGFPHWQVDDTRLRALKIPPTLMGVLQARLDGLRLEEKQTLQKASVVGRTFWDQAVLALSAKGRPSKGDVGTRTEKALEGTVRRELTFQKDVSAFENTREYVFKHALLRDVAYESVLIRERADLHARAASWLESVGAVRTRHYAGLIGEHWELAGKRLEAASWYYRAGRQACASHSLELATEFYQKALALLLHSSPKDPEREGAFSLECSLHKGLGDVLFPQTRYGDAIAAYGRLLEVATRRMDVQAMVCAHTGLSKVQDAQGDYRSSLKNAELAWEVVAKTPPDVYPSERIDALLQIGKACFRLGFAARGLEGASQALLLARAQNDATRTVRALSLLGMLNWMSGRYGEANAYYQQALEIEREVGDRTDVANRLNNLAVTANEQGEYGRALPLCQEALSIAREIGDQHREQLYLSNIGDISFRLGKLKEAKEVLQRVIRLAGESTPYFLPDTHITLARVCLEQGELDAAAHSAVRALELEREAGNPQHIGEAWQTLGLIAARAGSIEFEGVDKDAAECFEVSLRVFREADMDHRRARTLEAWAAFEHERGNHAKGAQLDNEARALLAQLGLPLENSIGSAREQALIKVANQANRSGDQIAARKGPTAAPEHGAEKCPPRAQYACAPVRFM